MKSLHHLIHERLEIIHYIIDDILAGDGLEVGAGAVDLGLFHRRNVVETQCIHCAFCFGYEVDVLDAALIKGDRPVGIVFADRRGNVESAGEFDIDGYVAGWL